MHPRPEDTPGRHHPCARIRFSAVPGEDAQVSVEPLPGAPGATEGCTAVLVDYGLGHYFHFMEMLIWLRALHEAWLGGTPLRRVVMSHPRWMGATQNFAQRTLLDTLYPGVEVLDSGTDVVLEASDVLLVDRRLAHTRINKMLEGAVPFAGPAVRRMRAAVCAALEVPPGAGDGPPAEVRPGLAARLAAWVASSRVRGAPPPPGRPRALYVPREPPRRLAPDAEARLLAELERRFELTVADFARMPWPEQVRLSARQDLMVGVHGNGLTNLLWLRPGATVLELFPVGVHHYDYQVFCELNGIHYYGFEGDRVFRDFGRAGEAYGHGPEAMAEVPDLPGALLGPVLDRIVGAG